MMAFFRHVPSALPLAVILIVVIVVIHRPLQLFDCCVFCLLLSLLKSSSVAVGRHSCRLHRIIHHPPSPVHYLIVAYVRLGRQVRPP